MQAPNPIQVWIQQNPKLYSACLLAGSAACAFIAKTTARRVYREWTSFWIVLSIVLALIVVMQSFRENRPAD